MRFWPLKPAVHSSIYTQAARSASMLALAFLRGEMRYFPSLFGRDVIRYFHRRPLPPYYFTGWCDDITPDRGDMPFPCGGETMVFIFISRQVRQSRQMWPLIYAALRTSKAMHPHARHTSPFVASRTYSRRAASRKIYVYRPICDI